VSWRRSNTKVSGRIGSQSERKYEMKGFLKQRSEGSWTIVLYLGRDPVTGKTRQKRHTVNGNKKQAQAELNRFLHEIQTGSYTEPAKLTVKEYRKRLRITRTSERRRVSRLVRSFGDQA
jgi:hypothetical protein